MILHAIRCNWVQATQIYAKITNIKVNEDIRLLSSRIDNRYELLKDDIPESYKKISSTNIYPNRLSFNQKDIISLFNNKSNNTMIKHNLGNWEYSTKLEGLLFFAQRMNEALWGNSIVPWQG